MLIESIDLLAVDKSGGAVTEGGVRLNVDVGLRYLEAWLLRLHGIYPPLDRCSACDRPLAAGPLRYHSAAHGFVCEACGAATGPTLSASARAFVGELLRRPPASFKEPSTGDAAPLEAFHHDLICRHLERDLRSYRVMTDVARGMRP